MEGFKTAFKLENGGIWMWLLVLISIFVVAVVVERIYFLFFKYNTNAKTLFQAVQRSVMADNIDQAIKNCNAAGSAAVAQVIKAGLTRANKSDVDIQNALEEASLEIMPNITKGLPTLNSLANIVTLAGLLGTIVGLISAFGALESAAPDKRQEMLSKGIAIAMNTTALALLIAIPALCFHAVLSAVARRIIADIELCSTKLANMLSARTK